jgi:hypothetical protein
VLSILAQQIKCIIRSGAIQDCEKLDLEKTIALGENIFDEAHCIFTFVGHWASNAKPYVL